jgi:hypothetical protein
MATYFLPDTPQAAFERMMTQIPRPGKGDGRGERKATCRRRQQKQERAKTDSTEQEGGLWQ